MPRESFEWFLLNRFYFHVSSVLKDLGLKFPAKAHRRLFGNLARNGKRCSIASPHDIVLIKSQSEWQIPGRIGRKIILRQKLVFQSKPNLEVFPHDFNKEIHKYWDQGWQA